MGAVNTTYTFTATDTITSTKMNNIIDETVMTSDAVLGGSGGSGGLDISSGKLSISANAINNSRLASNSVTSANIVDGTIVNADINASAAIAGTKISPSFGSQTIRQDGASAQIVQYNASSSSVTDFGIGTLTGDQNSVGINVANSTGVLSLGTNNTERMRITASGNVGIGTNSPTAPLHVNGQASINSDPELTITGSSGYINFHNSLASGSYNGIVASGDKSIIFSDGTSGTGAFVIAPWAANTSGIRINSSGNVGICKASPSTALDVNGTVTATAFSGPLTGNVTGDVTGNVTGDVTGSSGSCTGNSATATLATKASTLSNGGGNGSAMTFNWNGQSGQPDWVWGSINASGGANHYVWNPANFSVNYANSAGSATTASTVSNSAITAAKLDGNQSGSAPIFGVRAWVNFNGTSGSVAIRQDGNVDSVSRTGTGLYTINLTTAMDDTNYAIVGFARDAGASPGNYFVSAVSNGTKTTSSFQIRVHSTGGLADSPEINIMVIR